MKTKQSFKDAADINLLVAKWRRSGEGPPPRKEAPQYGDFADAQDYKSALDRVIDAQVTFESLPSSVRTACENDPGKFLDLVHDPDRRGELVELGLLPEHEPAKEPEVKTPQAETETEAKLDVSRTVDVK